MSDLVMVIAIIYATIVALSYSKVGFLPALFFPITIVILGTLQYIIFMTYTPPPE